MASKVGRSGGRGKHTRGTPHEFAAEQTEEADEESQMSAQG